MYKLYQLLFFMSGMLLWTSCHDDAQQNTAYDPNLPIIVTDFMPDNGGIRTKFIVKGSNFGNDKSKVKVFFKDSEGKERESLILSMTSNIIYMQVPKQSGGQSSIKVSIDGHDAEVNNPDKTFKYIVAASVSTVVGKAKEAGRKNGTIGETTFNLPIYVGVDDQDNIFVVDDPHFRLVSQSKNKSITIFDGGKLGQPLFLNRKKTKIFNQGDNSSLGCFLFDSEISWVPERQGFLEKAGIWMHSCILDPIDSTYIVSRESSGRVYVQPFKPGMTPEKNRQIAQIGEKQSDGLFAYNPVDNYVYCALHSHHAIRRFKMKKGPDGWPMIDGEVESYIENGPGFADGPLNEAKFSEPRGLAVDAEGDIYVADCSNHRIRKIDTKLGIVTTAAGTGQSGYNDGLPEEAQFKKPWGVSVDKNGFIYIADYDNHCVRKLAVE